MNALKKLLLTVGASGAVLALAVGPVAAAEAPDDDATAEAEADAEEGADDAAEGDGAEDDGAEAEGDEAEENGKIALAETPRDRIGLIMIAALAIGGWFAATNARRQLKGERPQASGEFRWR